MNPLLLNFLTVAYTEEEGIKYNPMSHDVTHLSRWRYSHTLVWAIGISLLIVGITAGLGRAALNLKAALTDKPDVGIYLLLPQEEISDVTVLREFDNERDYLIQTKEGPKFVKLLRVAGKWEVGEIEVLRGEVDVDLIESQ